MMRLTQKFERSFQPCIKGRWPVSWPIGEGRRKVASAKLFCLTNSSNLYRDDSRTFAADGQAREIMTMALARGFDAGMSKDERRFLYMPLQHSEDAADQARSVELFRALEDGDTFKYTLRHQEIIERFGRFPHRNASMGRESTAEEIAFLQEPDSSF